MGKYQKKKDLSDASQTAEEMALNVGSTHERHKGAIQDIILQAIAVSREALELKIQTLVMDLGPLQYDNFCSAERVTTTEQALDKPNSDVASMCERFSTLEGKVKTLRSEQEMLQTGPE
ncbi:hypothetical protein NDU88_005515 [Pleurodeles waltl]|uniref:Uncharacterized protein n=1 Tax=Pleurodeles waltl TaxID=8319 RepID=A0AAV7RMJ5_PLEWA|nr:hypothetical protein NDU88_005515 [Pleurodeles waltl]